MKKTINLILFLILTISFGCNSWDKKPGVVVYRELLIKNDSCEVWIRYEYELKNVKFDTIISSGDLNTIQPEVTSRYNR